jgi:hypothetical protein
MQWPVLLQRIATTLTTHRSRVSGTGGLPARRHGMHMVQAAGPEGMLMSGASEDWWGYLWEG